MDKAKCRFCDNLQEYHDDAYIRIVCNPAKLKKLEAENARLLGIEKAAKKIHTHPGAEEHRLKEMPCHVIIDEDDYDNLKAALESKGDKG